MDKSYNETMFISKVNNMMIQILNAEMIQKIDNVRHFLSDEEENILEKRINYLKKQNYRQMYDELNASNTVISNISETETKYIIEVDMTLKYMDYIIDMNGKFISGNNTSRSINYYHVIFEKVKDAKGYSIVRKCKNCGHSMNISLNGKCEYCGSIFNLEDYDYIITKITKV